MTEILDEEIWHIGTPQHSGRYPWGSGENPEQRNRSFLGYVDDLRKKGMTDKEIYEGLGMNSTQFRANNSIAKNAVKQEKIQQAMRLKEEGNSNIAIGKLMDMNESSVRDLLNPATKDKADVLTSTSNMLKDQMKDGSYLDIGAGSEQFIGVSAPTLKNAVAVLQEQGYKIQYLKVEQLGTGQFTTVRVLTKDDVTYSELLKTQDKVKIPAAQTEDRGRTYEPIPPPISIDGKRVGVRYAEEGGADSDGVIHIRRGVDDVSLGKSQYAQVRIAVDDTHYIKGMAMYSDDLPKGVDLMFNTNKSDTGNKMDALKGMKDDEDNPFGAVTRVKNFVDADGKTQQSVLNIVNEEGDWSKWSNNLSSQMLSKQSPLLAKRQLDLTLKAKLDEYDVIEGLTNPTIKKKLMESFADDADSSAVHLKAAAMPRQSTHVILPINSVKDNEIYAPNYNDGDRVVLVRYPHGGKFEIPELVVNNKNREANRVMKQATDAVGINSKVAARLSGADFDGDTVLVIPNNKRDIKNEAPLAALKGFDPQSAYPKYDGMKTMDGGIYNAKTNKVEFAEGKSPSGRTKQQEMGNISNLITDMTIMGAPNSEIARAVKHSMVVIDAEKHKLNYKQSAKDNRINELKKVYQGGASNGANTLISQASSEQRVNKRKARSAKDGGAIDQETGAKRFVETGESYIKTKTHSKGVVTEEVVFKKDKSTRMAETDDARTLISKPGTPMESVYADHANKLKALGNSARKEAFNTPSLKYSHSANKAYANEAATLKAKLNIALKNAPLERNAQLVAHTILAAKRQANPNMDGDALKKARGQALDEARRRTGADKKKIEITPVEWNAIQSGAISNNFLSKILSNTDLDEVKRMAMPRDKPVMLPAKVARAKAMLRAGHTQAEIAGALGVSPSTLNSTLTQIGA